VKKSKIIENQKQLINEYINEISRLEDMVHIRDFEITSLNDRIKEKDKIIQTLVDAFCDKKWYIEYILEKQNMNI